MDMEHRYGGRRALGLPAFARRKGWRGSVVGRLRDISVSGVFLEAAPGAFPLRSVVLVEVALPDAVVRSPLRARATVARVAADGVGLAFERIRPAGFAPLFAQLLSPLRPGCSRQASDRGPAVPARTKSLPAA